MKNITTEEKHLEQQRTSTPGNGLPTVPAFLIPRKGFDSAITNYRHQAKCMVEGKLYS